MPAKKVQIEREQGAGFKAECRAGKHTIIIDQPAASGGTDAGPPPLAYQLITLAGCITTIGRKPTGQPIMCGQRRVRNRISPCSVPGNVASWAFRRAASCATLLVTDKRRTFGGLALSLLS